MLNVEEVRDVKTTFHVMSLSVLNEGRDELPQDYREHMERAWLSARTAMGVDVTCGSEALAQFYTAIGTRYHPQGLPVGDIDVVKDALNECGLDPAIADKAAEGGWDAELRESHHAGMDPVGDQVGTPVIHINGKALFGPVISPAPKGEEAGRLFDGVALVTSVDGFFELKRSRDRDPIFD